ncbi:AGC/GRK/BARK protein kinase, variant 1 [Aphanomyces invadans]|uniref:G protein-coupled receptor kinase n=1 Tax=Aphanomyces invadans TaxID=157072 RepID=A0A024UGM0_9STRA|nr:AGC/GRK/BARK protein kinase, variant 1 [Aphanomyces invadans]XP_008866228.1 AGC/GRK/BARK protein kinase [Aphanomyces invadans]ETW04788.1 AGC/GRK/BARK protein kinase [Aphanomyces invadans]ETW04789.1 AGC/GRK/BARK protein kinase, variant 1 [Aphanomyces invadans]|eukprot:XP_008866226.1 AGC/GRK/BARK protein kinase, variant 1 [Aphanomyces invadans]
MDELQDAIQDAQYIGAMADPRPRPTVPFHQPSPQELTEFTENVASHHWPTMESYLSQPLGLYLFRRYCEAEAHGIEKLCFLQDVYAYRRIPQHNRRVLKAKAIYATYIHPQTATTLSSTDPPTAPPTTTSPGVGAAPSATIALKTHPLLASTKNPGDTNYAWKQESSISMTTARELYCTFKCEAALLGVRGDLTEDIGKQLEDANLLSGSATSTLPLTLFDELEACVVSALEHHQMEGFKASAFFKRFMHFLLIQQREIGEDDFSLLRVLGRGGFGMVNGAIKRSTGKLYAMKAMNKRIIKKKHAEKLCLAERAILTMLSSPFVVCLKYAFQTKEDLFLVLDLRTGGDLSFHLNRGRFTEEQVMYWSAQILLGLQHLHEKNIVYRDLKPENILLDDKGNCSISDLGLAVEVTPSLCGRCGTRGYWAPEMLLRDEAGNRLCYNQTVDWWSYGCVVYEMLYGKCPFRTSKAKALHADKQKAYDMATLELTPSYDPKYFSPEATELLQKLLIRDPTKRLGARGADEVKKMKFFESVDWVQMENMAIPPPFVPERDINAASQADIGFFDPSVIQGVKLSDSDQDLYKDWHFCSATAFQNEIVEFMEWEVKQGPITLVTHTNTCCNVS